MEDRRVRQLRLRVPSHVEAQRASFVMEDALRTADLFSTEPSRLFVVRRLDAGFMPIGVSPFSAARQVEDRLRDTLSHAVFAGGAAADHAPAVYFSDFAQALALFVRRLAAGGMTDEWFWSLVIPGWYPGMGRVSGFRLALTVAGDIMPASQEGAAHPAVGQAVLLASLLEQSPSAFERLLGALDHSDGLSLLAQSRWESIVMKSQDGGASQAIGQQHFDDSKRDHEPEEEVQLPSISAAWRAALRTWVGRWGVKDPRLTWLFGVALVVANTAWVISPNRLIHAIGKLQMRVADDVSNQPARPFDEQSQAALAGSARLAPVPEKRDRSFLGPTHDVDSDLSPVDSDKGFSSAHTKVVSRKDHAHISTRAEAERVDTSEDNAAQPLYTRWAGLYYLLPALIQLGVPDVLAAQPEYIELELPQRILLRAASWVGIPVDDAVVLPLTVYPDAQAEGFSFIAPPVWKYVLTSPNLRASWRLRRSKDIWLLCSHGGLPISIWRGRAPIGAHAWLRSQTSLIQRDHRVQGTTIPDEPVQLLDLILDAWLAALRRWIRLTSGLSLRELLNHAGRIYSTSTYQDVILPLSSVDIRIRRAGLDLDPGWLPWFGRVVKFKYLEE